MNSTSCLIGGNFPVRRYPESNLSERRMALLDNFNRRLEGRNCPDDVEFRGFLARFSNLGPIDTLRNCFTGGDKADILIWAAQCHVSSYGAGRDFLVRDQMLDHATDASQKLLDALQSDARDHMLRSARIGPRFQIVLSFPEVALNLPLGRSCFGTEPGALSYDEARALLLGRDGGTPSLLERFSSEMDRTRTPYSDMDVWAAWYACIERCIGGKPIREFSADPTEFRTLGFALRALASRVSECSNASDLPLLRMLANSLEAFDHAQDGKNVALGWSNIAGYHLQAGDEQLASRAYTHAGGRFTQAAELLMAERKSAEGNQCMVLAHDAYEKAAVYRANAAVNGGASGSTVAQVHAALNGTDAPDGRARPQDVSGITAPVMSSTELVNVSEINNDNLSDRSRSHSPS
ncbi:hypothetical protein PAN31117_00550 [Pandoraea anapnoica]|uniref:Uncharacterized protein n=1 Tax=Pandoraea anapnoica TaxID=2508301 RepID=A0A5E4ZK56_9BURK|nr:hypothetical protein [Pandoraea anapnoica]VVE61356.1 hypothetical protein PAN31117_00550 [Pandoraea anapnoica]